MSKKNKYEKYLEDVFVTESGKPYLAYETEDEGDIAFASITGKGIKIDKKNKYMSYKVSLIITEEEAERINGIAQAIWDEYKPKGADDKPVNSLTFLNPKDDKWYINPHCQVTDAEGNENVIGMIDSQLNKLDPAMYGKIGDGSTGWLNVNFTIYDEGVSMYLNGLQLGNYVAYAGGKGDGTGGFKAKGGKALDEKSGKGMSKKDKKKKKKKKKRKIKFRESHYV